MPSPAVTGLLLSLIAVLLVAALNTWLGRDGRLQRSRGEPEARIASDCIDFEPVDVERARDGSGCLMHGRTGDVAVAVARGDGWVTRRYRALSPQQVCVRDAVLTLDTGDFSLPRITLTCGDAERAALWATRLTGAPARLARTDG
jgi:hypothetical protein